jgi:glycosyltransferase involved in cell wall biosynthesis
MKVGVLMPCKSPLDYVRPAVESVLAQTHGDFVLVIVADGCDGDVNAYLAGLNDRRIRLIQHPSPQGVAKSLNEGLRALDTEIVFRMDADDIAVSDRFAKQLEHLRKNPELAVLGAQTRSFSDDPREKLKDSHSPCDHAAIAYRLCWSNALQHPTVVFRREAVMAAGGYDESLINGEDYALWTRMATRWQMGNMKDCLLSYRVHGAQNSRIDQRQFRHQIAGRYRQTLTGVMPSFLFDVPASWTRDRSPTLTEWHQWLEFMQRLADVFLSGRIGEIRTEPLNPKRDLVRRLWRPIKAARRLGTACPAEAMTQLKRLAPFYALFRGVI